MTVKTWTPCLALLLLMTSCQYQEPLVAKPELELDSAVVGSWAAIPRNENDDAGAGMVVLPFSDKEYMVIYRSNGDAMYFRAYRGAVGSLQLVQLQWLGFRGQTLEANHKPYQVCRYKVEDDTLTVSVLNPEVVPPGPAAAMLESLTSNLENPELFTEPFSFRRVSMDTFQKESKAGRSRGEKRPRVGSRGEH